MFVLGCLGHMLCFYCASLMLAMQCSDHCDAFMTAVGIQKFCLKVELMCNLSWLEAALYTFAVCLLLLPLHALTYLILIPVPSFPTFH